MFAIAPMALATVKKPVRSLSEMKGMNIQGPNNLLNFVGATPGPRERGGTLFSNMEKGVIDGVIRGWQGQRGAKVTNIAQYYTVFPGVNFFSFIMNKDKWNSLPPYIQDGIMSVSGDVASELVSECDHKNNQQVIDQILAKGKEIIYLSSNDTAKLTEAGMKMKEKQVTELEAKGLPARAVLNEILAMINEYNQ